MFNRLHRHPPFGHGKKASSTHSSDKKGRQQSSTLYDPPISSQGVTTPASSQARANTSASEPPFYIENHFRRKFPAAGSGSGTFFRRQTSTFSHNSSTSRRVGSIDNNLMSSTAERGRSRRERTFVGSECTVCEEPLEHTLQGERILQFSCSHAAHEACFYELIRECDPQFCPTCDAPLHFDTGRGGNVLDIKKLSNMVRSASAADASSTQSSRLAWDSHRAKTPSVESTLRNSSYQSVYHGSAIQRDSHDLPTERYLDSSSRLGRHDGDLAGMGLYPENAQGSHQWRPGSGSHTADAQTSQRQAPRNPIPDPIVTVRSEFPSISKSRQQQTFTCLVTVEVPSNKWIPDPEDLGYPPMPQLPVASSNVDDALPVPPTPRLASPRFMPDESAELLEEMTESLRGRVDNWHGLDYDKFGPLRLFSTLRVGKDKSTWTELECFLFAEMLICVKEKKLTSQWDENGAPQRATRCNLKGSILVKKHLNDVTETGTIDENILTLNLSVVELPQFHLRFENRNQLKLWHQALMDLHAMTLPSPAKGPSVVSEIPETDEDVDWQRTQPQRASSNASSWGRKSATTAQTEYTTAMVGSKAARPMGSIHVPIDIVVVVPISSSMQGVKINLVRDALRFMVSTLGERDRMGIVAFGSGGGGVPIVGMTTKAWLGWSNVLNAIKPVGQKSHRADVVEGANVAMDLLMQRKHSNPVATIMLISDASTSDADSVDFVVSRAEAAKIAIHSFGLGMTHKPDTMIELSTRTKASYTYVKDWMMLRECLAGCVGAMQTLSHQNVKLKLKLPEGSPAKFHKISGALQITKRATGRDAEASLGDLRFGDKRDVLIQLVIAPDNSSQEQSPQNPWDNIIQDLEVLGSIEGDSEKNLSVEEVPLIQADLTWGDILRDGATTQMPRPSLMAITMLPGSSNPKSKWQSTPPIPPHPSVVQRRMELLTSDMLTRALTLLSRGQHDRAHTLLNETRSILKGLGKGGLPPVPPPGKSCPTTPRLPAEGTFPALGTPPRKRSPSPPTSAMSMSMSIPGSFSMGGQPRSTVGGGGLALGIGIDATTVAALDAELESSLEWINHPAVFVRDSRKAVLQAIGVLSSQRAFTFRSPIESLWAERIGGIKRLADKSREWREEGGGEGGITEEA